MAYCFRFPYFRHTPRPCKGSCGAVARDRTMEDPTGLHRGQNHSASTPKTPRNLSPHGWVTAVFRIMQVLLGDRILLLFLLCAFFFHFANAAMLPQLGEMLSRGASATAAPFMSAC